MLKDRAIDKNLGKKLRIDIKNIKEKESLEVEYKSIINILEKYKL